jgi:CheY-like chemotaxis protein
VEQTQKQDSLGLLAGGIAHDFNNLLTGILGNASLALDCMEEGSEARALIEDVVRAGERAAVLTAQLLAYAGKGRFTAGTIDLNQLTRNVSGAAWTSVSNPAIELILDLKESLPAIHADPHQLNRVIESLAMNGAEAIGEGRGIVRVSTRVETVAGAEALVSATGDPVPPGRYAVLEVRDTGAGMDAATRARIFEPFFSTKFTGRGMGLSAVLGIVRRHGGFICVDSALGKGSSFRVLLPLTVASADGWVGAIAAKGPSGAGLVLVVDDEETVREMVRRTLERWRYQVILAENGQAAVEIFPRIAASLHAVILDLTMPVMGGEEALTHLRRIRADIPILLTSGYSEEDAMRRMEGRGVSGFLQKPFTADQLGRQLRSLSGVEKVAAAGGVSEFHGEREGAGDRLEQE